MTADRTPVEDVREAIKDVIDPELGVNVVDLGLLYGLHYADDGALIVDMTLTTAACPLTDEIEDQVSRAISTMVDEWRLNWVWMPPWGPERITEDGKDLQQRIAEHFDRHVHELMVAGLDSEELRILTRLSDRLRHSLSD